MLEKGAAVVLFNAGRIPPRKATVDEMGKSQSVDGTCTSLLTLFCIVRRMDGRMRLAGRALCDTELGTEMGNVAEKDGRGQITWMGDGRSWVTSR